MPGGARSMKGEKQMIYKNITFKADPFSYDLVFEDRITLVGGDSGTGKTVLYEIRRFVNFEFSNQYMLFLRNCDGLNVSDKSFKVLKLDNNRITLEEKL
jgi:hypothetical protein